MPVGQTLSHHQLTRPRHVLRWTRVSKHPVLGTQQRSSSAVFSKCVRSDEEAVAITRKVGESVKQIKSRKHSLRSAKMVYTAEVWSRSQCQKFGKRCRHKTPQQASRGSCNPSDTAASGALLTSHPQSSPWPSAPLLYLPEDPEVHYKLLISIRSQVNKIFTQVRDFLFFLNILN